MIWFHLVEILIKGFVLGFILSIPLGPIGVICIQRTLSKGRWSGFISGLGASTADTLLAITAGLGLSFIINFIKIYSDLFKLLGGIVVIIIGFQIFFKSPVRQFRNSKLQRSSLHTDYLSVLALTFSNPLAIFLFIAIFAGLNIVGGSHDLVFNIFIFSGIFLGSATWWFTLTSFVNIYRAKFRLKNLWWLNKITGILIALFGLIAMVSILFHK